MKVCSKIQTLWLCAATAVFCQTQAPSPTLQTRAPADQQLTVEAIVHNRPGTPAELPDAANLRVRIDKKQLSASDVTMSHRAPELMFVLDAINTPRENLVRCQQALLTWLHNAGEHLPFDTSILIVADTQPAYKDLASSAVSTWTLIPNELFVSRLAPTHNPVELAAKLNAYEPGLARIGEASNAVSGSERVHISLQSLSFLAAAIKGSPAPKLILWLSPGWPFVHMTENGYSSQLFDSIVYFDDALRSAHVILYALDPTGAATDRPAPTGDEMLSLRPGANQNGGPAHQPSSRPNSDFYRNFLNPVQSARNADPNDMVLPVLALHSGGTVQTSSNDLLGGIDRFAADADAVLSVTLPTPAATGGIRFHSIEIMPSDANLIIRSRQGFYAR